MADSTSSSRKRLRALPGGQEQPLDDEALIAGLLEGDQQVARELYRKLINSVDHTLYRLFGRREQDHDDLVQATFEQIILTLTTRRFAGACSLKTWASTLATNVGLRALRNRVRERKVLDRSAALEDSVAAVPSNAEFELDLRAEIERLRQGLARINPRRAEVLFLHDVLGHDMAEISVLKGLSVSATQSLLVRGRSELAVELGRAERWRTRRRR